MKGIRLFLAGVRDLYDNIFRYTLYSLIFWVIVIPLLLAPATPVWWLALPALLPFPPAVLGLLHMTDPRMGTSDIERTSWSGLLRFVLGHFWRAWGLWLITLIPAIICYLAILFYSTLDGVLVFFSPIFALLLLICLFISWTSFSVMATLDLPLLAAWRTGVTMSVGQFFTIFVAALGCLLLMLVVSPAILPVLIFGPTLIAAVINRITLTLLKVEISDGRSPTPERLAEDRQKRDKKRSSWR